MPNFVRVRDELGHEFSINELAVQEGWRVLDEPALDATGRVRKGSVPKIPAKKAAPASTPETHNHSEE